MRDQNKALNQFAGVAKDVSPLALPDGLYQEDHGGDRYRRGAWRRRRGMLRTDLDKVASPITSILGFELAGDDYALALVEGTNVHGFVNVDDQDYSTGGGGFGESSFGEGFGE